MLLPSFKSKSRKTFVLINLVTVKTKPEPTETIHLNLLWNSTDAFFFALQINTFLCIFSGHISSKPRPHLNRPKLTGERKKQPPKPLKISLPIPLQTNLKAKRTYLTYIIDCSGVTLGNHRCCFIATSESRTAACWRNDRWHLCFPPSRL